MILLSPLLVFLSSYDRNHARMFLPVPETPRINISPVGPRSQLISNCLSSSFCLNCCESIEETRQKRQLHETGVRGLTCCRYILAKRQDNKISFIEFLNRNDILFFEENA